jgi:hypothetical protein
MNEHRDPITEWTDAILSRAGHGIIILLVFAFICGLIAPIFGSFIRAEMMKGLVMEPNYEAITNKTMPKIWTILWIWAIISWFVLIFLNLHPITS